MNGCRIRTDGYIENRDFYFSEETEKHTAFFFSETKDVRVPINVKVSFASYEFR